MAADLKPVTVAVEYANQVSSIGGPTTVRSSTSMGAMRAAVLSYPPPRQSLASVWQGGNTASTGDTLFYITCPANSILDLSLEQQLVNDEGRVSCGATVSGATIGQIYVRALDSNATTPELVPVSYPTI